MKFLIKVLLALAVLAPASAEASSAAYQPTASISALQAYGPSSATTVKHAIVAGTDSYDWSTNCPTAPLGISYIQASGVAMSTGCWQYVSGHKPIMYLIENNGQSNSQGQGQQPKAPVPVPGTVLQYTPNLGLASASWSGGVATFNGPLFIPGDLAIGNYYTITLSGFSPSPWNFTALCQVTTNNQFQCPLAGNPGALVTTGTYTPHVFTPITDAVQVTTGSAWPAFGITFLNAPGNRGNVVTFIQNAGFGTCLIPVAGCPANNWSPTGTLRDIAVQEVKDAMALAIQQGYVPIFVGETWTQGEAEIANINSSLLAPGTYGPAFSQLNAYFRANLGANMRIIVQRPGPHVAIYAGHISGTTLTIDSVPGAGSAAIAIGQTIVQGAAAGTTITAGSGTSWTVSISQTVAASTPMSSWTLSDVGYNSVASDQESVAAAEAPLTFMGCRDAVNMPAQGWFNSDGLHWNQPGLNFCGQASATATIYGPQPYNGSVAPVSPSNDIVTTQPSFGQVSADANSNSGFAMVTSDPNRLIIWGVTQQSADAYIQAFNNIVLAPGNETSVLGGSSPPTGTFSFSPSGLVIQNGTNAPRNSSVLDVSGAGRFEINGAYPGLEIYNNAGTNLFTYGLTGSTGELQSFASLNFCANVGGTVTGGCTAQLAIGSTVQVNVDLGMLGSSTGVTTLHSANASATNYTITVPAATGTLALTTSALPLVVGTSTISGGTNGSVESNNSGVLGEIVATSANTASAIVQRNGSGNFTAGTVTASLTGHASLDVALTGSTMTGKLTINSSVNSMQATNSDTGSAVGYLVASSSSYADNVLRLASNTVGTTGCNFINATNQALSVSYATLGCDGALTSRSVVAGGSAPTLTGTCTTASQTGGNAAGTFTATCTAQTVIITFGTTAPHGWTCVANDNTTSTDTLRQTDGGTSATSCTLTGTTVATDRISFSATAF